MKTITLFLATNLAVLIVLSFFLKLFGISHIGGLIFFALIFGMGGSFISLAMSKWIAKMSTGAQIIEQPSNSAETWLIETVHRQANAAGIGMPEVAIYDAPDPNAFATGMNRDNALVAVSTGLLEVMDEDEVEAVLAHEVSHIANGDMVTLTLIQGVINTFVIVIARLIGQAVDSALSSNEEETSGPGIAYWVTSIVAEIILGILASTIVFWFSRIREFHADAGSARLVGADKMIRALQRLQMMQEGHLPAQLAAFGINGSKGTSLVEYLFMSHPPLEDRIAALQESRYP
jgi:heat shock protein HtpX